jgi:hypothetical protein
MSCSAIVLEWGGGWQLHAPPGPGLRYETREREACQRPWPGGGRGQVRWFRPCLKKTQTWPASVASPLLGSAASQVVSAVPDRVGNARKRSMSTPVAGRRTGAGQVVSTVSEKDTNLARLRRQVRCKGALQVKWFRPCLKKTQTWLADAASY